MFSNKKLSVAKADGVKAGREGAASSKVVAQAPRAGRPNPRPAQPGASGPLDLGSRLRDLRGARDWTLEDASQRTGVARSTLSKIENGLMSPTFDILQKIVGGLEIEVSNFFRADRPNPAARRSVTRLGDGAIHEGPQYRMELLATDIANKAMLPLKVTVRARSFEEFGGWIEHDGEEFICVTSGEIEVFTEFYAPVRLVVGESIYFDSQMRHAVISVGTEDAQVVWMATSRPDLPSDDHSCGARGRPAPRRA